MPLSSDPIQVLSWLKVASDARVVTAEDFVTPSGDDTRVIEVPGLLHPAHLGWIAEILGRAEETFREPNGLNTVVRELVGASVPPRLSALGVSAQALIVKRIPVLPGSQRPNSERTGLSPLNAAYQELFRLAEGVRQLTELGGPEIILESRAEGVQASFERLLHLLEGKGHLFTAQRLEDPAELVVLPSRRSAGLMGSPLIPAEIRVVGTTALISFPVALACVDLSSGQFSVQPFAGASFAAITDAEAAFCDGARLSVFDVARREFVTQPRQVPSRVALGACCGVEILDTETRTTAILPGPLPSSAYGFATSPCGRYGWLDVVPQADEVGVFSVQSLERVCRVWPHRTLAPNDVEDPGEGHDGTPRALARLESGEFRFVYGQHLLQGPQAYELPRDLTAAGFDLEGRRLAVAAESELSVFTLDSLGRPTLLTRWSLAPLAAHLSGEGLNLAGTGLDVEALMGATGTIETLAGMTVEALSERVFFMEDPEPGAIERLIAEARALELPASLQPA